MSNLINEEKDEIALFDYMGYVLCPGQGTIDCNSQHFYKRGRLEHKIVDV